MPLVPGMTIIIRHIVTRKNKPREEISPRFDEIFRGMEKL